LREEQPDQIRDSGASRKRGHTDQDRHDDRELGEVRQSRKLSPKGVNPFHRPTPRAIGISYGGDGRMPDQRTLPALM
jgi:hypothetical protein